MNTNKSNIKDYFLVTTALQETWPEDNKSALFLGEWCRLYSKKSRWINMDGEVVPYHWDDRKKLYEDYKYLLKLFENVLEALVIELNNFHNVSHSSRYWRIVIGPWLMNFLTITFDRWSSINAALEKYSIVETKVNEKVGLNYIPENMEHFSNVVTTDLWNHAIYSSILKYLRFKKIKISNVPIDKTKWNIKRPYKKRYMISKIKNFLVTFCLFFSRNKNYFFMDTYLTKFDLVKLQLKLGQFPVFYSVPNYTELIPKEINRSITLSEFKCNNSFEHYLREVLPLQIPKAYIEGYKNLSKLTKNMHWPKKPKLIWTSISFYMDEIFKLWAANKIEEGVPLVIGQHGGNYGQAMFNMGEYHELKICDYYLSWGWKTHLKKCGCQVYGSIL